MELLIGLVFAVLIVGALVWGIDQIPAIDPTFKQVARVILIVVLVVYVLIVLQAVLTGPLDTPRRWWPVR